MFLTLTLFFLSAGTIYLACEYFVNGIEWFGRRLNLGATAVGSVLAAFGTALPENAVTFIAVVFGTTLQQKDIGVGAGNGRAACSRHPGLCCCGVGIDFPPPPP